MPTGYKDKQRNVFHMLYFFNFQYSPNNAANNRLLAYYRAFDQMGVKAHVVYVHPDRHYSKIEEKFSNLQVTYLWNKFLPYSGFFGKLTYGRYVNRFISMLKPGDIVYTYSVSALTRECTKIEGVKVYAERTEHPEASAGYPSPLAALTPEEHYETLHRLAGLFVISEPLRDYYSSQGVANSKIEIINMTVDPSRFLEIHKTSCKDRYIAYCGTASNNKDGVDELIKSFAIVAQHIPDVKLYIIGKTPSKEQKFGNMKLVESLGLKDRVLFTGIVKAENIPQLLMNAEVLALDRPDNLQAKYGFPTKLGEYLLTENPVVVTAVGDIPKFLKDGVSALIARPGDVEDFSSKLIWALTHKDEAARIGHRGYIVAMEQFNSFTETHKMVKFFMKQ